MKINETFTTDRIKARRLTPGDLDDLATLYQTPEVTATLGGSRSREEVIQALERHLNHWDEYGFGYFIFEDKESGAFMGRGGLQRCNVDGRDEVEVGYAFMPDYWGKGFATQVAHELLRIGFEELNLASIIGFTLPGNEASKRVLEKNGFVFEKEMMYKGLPHVLFRLSADQWHESKK